MPCGTKVITLTTSQLPRALYYILHATNQKRDTVEEEQEEEGKPAEDRKFENHASFLSSSPSPSVADGENQRCPLLPVLSTDNIYVRSGVGT